MISSWLVWLLVITAVLTLCFISADLGAVLLMAAVIIIPIVSAAINLIHKPKVSLNLNFPAQCEKKACVSGSVELSNDSALSYRRACVSLKLKNRLTGETADETVKASLMAKENSLLNVSFKARYCGTVEISCSELRIYDFFGLTFRRVGAEDFCAVTVLPELFPVNIQIQSAGGADDIESYAEDRPGPDLSEVYEFADYMPGDSLRQIQWKLSQKHDRLIVRRGSLPLENSALLVMTPALSNPARLSAVAETTVSVAQSLCESGISYKLLIWEDERFCGYEVETEEDLAELLPKLLSVEPHSKLPSDAELGEARHIVCITDDLHRAVTYSQSGAAVLLADGESEEGIIGFSSVNPSEDLFEIIF